MPKDIVHWIIARRAAARLADAVPALAADAAACPNALLLGSIFPDAGFYLAKAAPAALHQLPRILHGSQGEDTFRLLRLHAARLGPGPHQQARRAFLAGLVCHLASDITVHPFVYHHAGDPRADRRTTERHRLLETCLDMTAAGGLAGTAAHDLGRILDGLEAPLWELADAQGLAGLCGLDAATVRAGLDQAWKRFRRVQRAIRRPWLAGLLLALRPRLPQAGRSFAALFYGRRLEPAARALGGPLRWVHPVTGEPGEATLESFMDQSAALAADWCRQLLAALERGEPPLPQTGPGLGSGLPGVGSRQGRHFARPPFDV
ncbi:MAG: zinc dependent phospholipase C family protein [Desulfovibrionaceae bacterium]